MKYIFILFSLFYLNCHSIRTFWGKNRKQNTKQPILKQSQQIQSINVLNWNTWSSKELINFECNVHLDSCNETFNPFTANYCQQLTHFKTPVCGGQSCFFNESKQKCDGQCSNTILETCVSKVRNPTEDSDCVCTSSNVLAGTNNEESCDAATCYGNSCILAYFFINRISDGTLYAVCNNDS
jgi:hypothetical protein